MTKVLILAAGQGSRLRPLTNDLPKCLVPFMGKSLLERQISTLNKAGLKDIHIATGYKSEKIQELGYTTSFNPNYDKTNMVESLFSAIAFIEEAKHKDEDLIIAYGDIFYQLSNLNALLACNDDLALMIDKDWEKLWRLRFENPLDDAESLKLDAEGFVLELGKKAKSVTEIQGQYTGLIKVASDKIQDLINFYYDIDRKAQYDGQDFYNMYMTSFLQQLIDNGWKAKAALVNNGWLEIDSVDDLNSYETMAKDGSLSTYIEI